MAQTVCNQCDAQYNSERDLRNHMRTAHRKFGAEQRGPDSGDARTHSFVMQDQKEHESQLENPGEARFLYL